MKKTEHYLIGFAIITIGSVCYAVDRDRKLSMSRGEIKNLKDQLSETERVNRNLTYQLGKLRSELDNKKKK